MLTLIPVSLAQANEFVRQHHRHHKPVAGHKFSIGCSENGRLCAVAIVGRPVSRYLDDGFTLEVNRLCSDGTKNVKAFIAAVKKYTDLQELDAAVLRAFIDRIEVSHVDKKSRTREITIVYNFIGAFDFTRAIENARNTSKKEQRTA